jgi:hypothetical protein
MIQVVLAKEPVDFDAKVRQKGLAALDELIGRPPKTKRAGPKRKVVASRLDDIPADQFPPYWRDALDDLLREYHRMCAFLAVYLEHATGNPTVDHMLPKSTRRDLAYEWSNYRLCAGTINSMKRDLVGLVDPKDCREGWFELNLVSFEVGPGTAVPPHMVKEVKDTCKLLNGRDSRKLREEYAAAYWDKAITIEYLQRRAPFVANELRRQSRVD